MNLNELIRPSILELTAYSSARSLSADGEIFLDANESHTAPQIGQTENSNLNRYPSPQPKNLLEQFSRLYKVPTEQILIGRGSDEAIDLLTRTICEPGQDSILITPPTYGMYKVSADIQNVKTLSVPLLQDNESWSIDLDGIKRELSHTNPPKLVYICNPNNPTGNIFPIEDLKEVAKMISDKSLLVIDEAYGEFCESQSGMSLLKEFKNVAVLRTLSKSWGLAGLRCGVLIGSPSLIAVIQKVRAPYPLPQPVIELALRATNTDGEIQMKNRVQQTIAERDFMQRQLREMSDVIRIYPSQTNFLLVEFKNEKSVMAQARSKGIVLRDRNNDVPRTVRITIGDRKQNELLLAALQKDLS